MVRYRRPKIILGHYTIPAVGSQEIFSTLCTIYLFDSSSWVCYAERAPSIPESRNQYFLFFTFMSKFLVLLSFLGYSCTWHWLQPLPRSVPCPTCSPTAPAATSKTSASPQRPTAVRLSTWRLFTTGGHTTCSTPMTSATTNSLRGATVLSSAIFVTTFEPCAETLPQATSPTPPPSTPSSWRRGVTGRRCGLPPSLPLGFRKRGSKDPLFFLSLCFFFSWLLELGMVRYQWPKIILGHCTTPNIGSQEIFLTSCRFISLTPARRHARRRIRLAYLNQGINTFYFSSSCRKLLCSSRFWVIHVLDTDFNSHTGAYQCTSSLIAPAATAKTSASPQPPIVAQLSTWRLFTTGGHTTCSTVTASSAMISSLRGATAASSATFVITCVPCDVTLPKATSQTPPPSTPSSWRSGVTGKRCRQPRLSSLPLSLRKRGSKDPLFFCPSASFFLDSWNQVW